MARVFEADRVDTDLVTIAHVEARSLLDRALDRVANDTIELVDVLTGASRAR
jgi:hypothetical protein